MSQRLHVGKTSDSIYDCVIVTPDGAHDKLKREWLRYRDGLFIGPWKIMIGNVRLWRRVEPIVDELLTSLGVQYPDDVWVFYRGNRHIVHPTLEELRAWEKKL